MRLSRAIAEVSVVIIGVVLGLAADGWRQDRRDARLESQYVDRIYDDLSPAQRTALLEVLRQRPGMVEAFRRHHADLTVSMINLEIAYSDLQDLLALFESRGQEAA